MPASPDVLSHHAPSHDARPLSTTVLVHVGALVLGGVVALVGTFVHRQWLPWILVAALVLVAVAGVLVRAWVGSSGLLPYGFGWFAVVGTLMFAGPGGDVVLPWQAVSIVWLVGGMLMIGVAAFAPHRWFTD